MSGNFKKESVKPSEELLGLKQDIEPEFFCAYYLNEIGSRYVSNGNWSDFLAKFRTDLEELMQREGITPACLDGALLDFRG